MKKLPYLFFFILTIYLFPANGFGQQDLFFNRFLSENIIIQKGLSQNTVYTVYQDDEGFMWFGTWEGLNRFDGYSFVTYNREHGLSNETIRDIFQHDNILWVGTENGLNAINLEDGSIENYYAIEGDSASLSHNWINHITIDHLGMIWISTARGLTELNPDTRTFRQVFSRDYGNPFRSNYFNMLAQDAQHNYWIATSHGLVFFELKSNRITRFFHIPDDSTSLPDNHVQTLMFDDQQNLWVGTRNGIARFNEKQMNFSCPVAFKNHEITLERKQIQVMHQHENQIWIGTNGQGLYVYNIEEELVSAFSNHPNHQHTISDNRVFDIFTDQAGVMWIGTFNGLNKLNNLAPTFRTIRNNPDFSQGLSNNSIWCFEEDENNHIWIGTEMGVNIWHQPSQSFKHMTHQPKQANSLSGNEIRDIHRDKNGNFWIGTRYHGLNLYNPATNKFTHYRHQTDDSTSLPDDFVLSVLSDSKGNVWVGTDNGLGLLDPKLGFFKAFRNKPGTINSLPANRVYKIFEDSKHRIWVSTSNGLSLFIPNSQTFKNFVIPEHFRNTKGTLSNQFFSINEGHDGKLWIGTRNGGLVNFDPEKETFKVWTIKDGLPNNVVYLAIEDQNSDIWLSTNWGLTRFSPERNVFTNYEVTDGLQSNEFNFNAGMITGDGQLLFGGMSGFNSFYPHEITINKRPPEIRITTFRIFNEIVNRRLRDGDTIRLSYADHAFSFEFAALDYTNPSRIQYKYKLENYNNDWIERKASQRFAEYARVSPGTYVFRVIGSNSDGFWNEKGIRIHVIIRPPWYQTWIFRLFIGLLFVFIVYMIVYLRMRSIRRAHDVEMNYLAFEKKLFVLEQKALQLQMNPHFLFNSLNSIQSFIVKNDIDNAIHYLSKFSQLMRRTLSNSRESFVILRDELQALQLYLEIEKLRFSDSFGYTIQIDPEIDDSFVEIPPMILQPYVENAIIHGLMHKQNERRLKINISLIDEDLLVVIEDNGVGREKAAEIKRASGIERQSRGMLITGERLEILNQYTKEAYAVKVIDLFDKQGVPCGTRVEIKIHGSMI